MGEADSTKEREMEYVPKPEFTKISLHGLLITLVTVHLA